MRTIVFGFITAITLATQALANEPMPYCNYFDGFYFGGNLGAIGYTAYRNDLDGLISTPIPLTHHAIIAHDNHFTAGFQLGYDWQRGHKVLGAVVDWNWTNGKTFQHFNESFPGTHLSVSSSIHWFSTMRARMGFALESLLLYLTAGGAVTESKTKYIAHITGTSGALDTEPRFKRTCWGWTVGAGTEWALWCNWSINCEFLWLLFPEHRFSTVATTTGSVSTTTTYHFAHFDSIFVGRVGLNYRFSL